MELRISAYSQSMQIPFNIWWKWQAPSTESHILHVILEYSQPTQRSGQKSLNQINVNTIECSQLRAVFQQQWLQRVIVLPKKRDQPHVDKPGMPNKTLDKAEPVQCRRKRIWAAPKPTNHSIPGLHYTFKCGLFMIGTSEARKQESIDFLLWASTLNSPQEKRMVDRS